MSKILIANWKMNPEKETDAIKLAKATDGEHVVICPPLPFLSEVSTAINKSALGAQDISTDPITGPFTGEVSASQLRSMGIQYVIIGHSSRRSRDGETDEIVAKKIAAALDAGLIPILCVGETATERSHGHTREVLDRQLRMAFSLIPADTGEKKFNVIVAYEPVWAISTNQAPGAGGHSEGATPSMVQDMISYMKGIVRGMPITPVFIYGGSVDAENLGSFLECSEIHGALVGAVSLKAGEFKKMIVVASQSNINN